LKKSEELLFKRFLEDFDECASKFESESLTIEQMQKVLKMSGFVMQVRKHDPIQNDMALCQKLFGILGNGETVKKSNLRIFLSIIQGKVDRNLFNEQASDQ